MVARHYLDSLANCGELHVGCCLLDCLIFDVRIILSRKHCARHSSSFVVPFLPLHNTTDIAFFLYTCLLTSVLFKLVFSCCLPVCVDGHWVGPSLMLLMIMQTANHVAHMHM